MCNGVCDSDGCEEKAIYETEDGVSLCGSCMSSVEKNISEEEDNSEEKNIGHDSKGRLRKFCAYKEDGKYCCNKRPTYNEQGKKIALYCKEHKLEGMINVMNKRCLGKNGVPCNKQPTYNNQKEKVGKYCKEHKLEGMINVISRRCLGKNGILCDKIPVYNNEGETIGKYCVKHKDEGMVNVVNRRCIGNNGVLCDKQPTYNEQGKNIGKYCKEHKLEGMINVMNKRCLGKNGVPCNKQPTYNNQKEKMGKYCKEHKLEGMINVISRRCCGENGTLCDKISTYNNQGENVGKYCKEHKLEGMVDVRYKKCKNSCNEHASLLKKYQGLCYRCFIRLNPESKDSQGYKFREHHVVSYIKEQFPNENLVFDKSIEGGCSKKRPDVLFDKYTHSVILEIDEEQHKNYSCENKRMMELFQDLGSRPLILIRFNPDKFKDKSGKTIPSPFQWLKTGVPTIRLKKQWEQRLTTLKKAIITSLETVPEKEVSFVYLYYDGFDFENQEVVFEDKRCDE